MGRRQTKKKETYLCANVYNISLLHLVTLGCAQLFTLLQDRSTLRTPRACMGERRSGWMFPCAELMKCNTSWRRTDSNIALSKMPRGIHTKDNQGEREGRNLLWTFSRGERGRHVRDKASQIFCSSDFFPGVPRG